MRLLRQEGAAMKSPGALILPCYSACARASMVHLLEIFLSLERAPATIFATIVALASRLGSTVCRTEHDC